MTSRSQWIALLLLLPAVALAQGNDDPGRSYPDGHGGEVFFPLGDLSFADAMVSFEEGDPHATTDGDRIPTETLGHPDYTDDDNYLTLGCGGTIVLRFEDNALVDLEGPDLYVFEIGPAVEPTSLAISSDGTTWTEVGEISGGRADVDIADHVETGAVFHYVSLTDLRSDCSSTWPGADIDAVGAIGSALKLILEGAVLFDFDKHDLKPEATTVLTDLALKAKALGAVRLVVEGHTDAVGSDSYNQTLSEKRAGAVRVFLEQQQTLSGVVIDQRGYGESRPVDSNDTEEGRARNRRVEIIVIPGSAAP
ncbi:MAG: OmpA family protein [Thermoanaerobaculia bacterium]